jgi:hypothetical protein
MDQVFKLHGMPHSIVSESRPHFQQTIFGKNCSDRAQLHLSTTYYPQIDGQTKVVQQVFGKHISGVFHWKGKISRLNGYD